MSVLYLKLFSSGSELVLHIGTIHRECIIYEFGLLELPTIIHMHSNFDILRLKINLKNFDCISQIFPRTAVGKGWMRRSLGPCDRALFSWGRDSGGALF